jgi:DNA polymerase V
LWRSKKKRHHKNDAVSFVFQISGLYYGWKPDEIIVRYKEMEADFMENTEPHLTVIVPGVEVSLDIPYFVSTVKAGFPSPAEDYSEERLDLNKKLIVNPSNTFFVRVDGDSMKGDGISDGDLLVVDRSFVPTDKSIIVCFIDGNFTLKRLRLDNSGCFLVASNPDFKPIPVDPESDLRIWGVVTYSIKKHC